MPPTLITELLSSGAIPDSVLEAVESAALRVTGFKSALVESPALTVQTWQQIYSTKPLPAITLATALCARPLSRPQRELVITKEHRTGPLTTLIHHNQLDPDEQLALAGNKGFHAAQAISVSEKAWATPEAKQAYAIKFKGQVLLNWLAESTVAECTDQEAIALIEDFANWGPMDDTAAAGAQRAPALTRLFHRRPAVLAAQSVTTVPPLATSAAGCRFFTDRTAQDQIANLGGGSASVNQYLYALLALIANPVVDPEVVKQLKARLTESRFTDNPIACDTLSLAIRNRTNKHNFMVTEPYQVVSDPATLEWLVRRAKVSLDGRTRAFDLLALAQNPNLSDDQVRAVATSLEAYRTIRDLSDNERQCGHHSLRNGYPHLASELYPTREPSHQASHQGTLSHRPTTSVDPSKYMISSSPTEDAIKALAEYAAAKLGSDTNAWMVLFSLSEDFTGTFAELVQVSAAVSA